MSNETAKHVEAILFYSAQPMPIAELGTALAVDHETVERALDELERALHGRGIQLVRHEETVALATAPESASIIDAMRREELGKNLGKAALETLAIILYYGPITRSNIDYIRGVNSTFTLRNLLIRGLIERIPNPDDQRSYLYRATVDLIGQLGVTRVEELPEFSDVQHELQSFEAEQQSSGTEEAKQQDGTE